MTSGTDATAPHWRKSSYSTGGNQCVEIAVVHDGQVAVRDSANAAGAMLVVGPVAWGRFLGSARLAAADAGAAPRFEGHASWYPVTGC
jgi:hypothetical protein